VLGEGNGESLPVHVWILYEMKILV